MSITLRFDCAGLRVTSAYVTDLRRRPVSQSVVTQTADAVLVDLPQASPIQLHVSIYVEGFGRTVCTADHGHEGYGHAGGFDLLRELALSHIRRAERVVSTAAVAEPAALSFARAAFARSAWHDKYTNGMEALRQALIAGEDAARLAAERRLAERDPHQPGPLISATLFGERLDHWSIGVGPDWDSADSPPNFIRPERDNVHVAALCNATTLPTFWRWIEPQRGQPRWAVLDQLIEFCVDHDLSIKSFALYWGGIGGSPVWLRGLSYRQQLQAIEQWVTQVVQRYKGQIAAWETVNEMHNWFFGDPFGWSHAQFLEVTRLVNELVGALDPGKPRIINHCCIWGDYSQNQPEKWSPLTYLDDVVQAGIPFDGIGIQYYNPGRDLLECIQQLDTFAEFGKSLWITEMGTPSAVKALERVETGQIAAGSADPIVGWRGPWSAERQAEWVELWYTLAASRSSVRALNWWDFSDGQAFVAHAGLLDADGQPKLAYRRLQEWCKAHQLGKAAQR